MKTLFILITTLFAVAFTSCGTSNNFSRKKYLRIGMLAPGNTETNFEADYFQAPQMIALNENNVPESSKVNVTQEDSSIAEVENGLQPAVANKDYIVQNDGFVVSDEVNIIEDEVSVPIEKPIVKFKSNKLLTKIKGNAELSWVGTILVALAVIILLPLVLIGLMVLYLYFFPAW
jgi:hypothetical protein